MGNMSSRAPGVSVVIACHNDGKYLDEAINSVLKQTYDDVQIVVIDDGSTEENTVRLLQEFERPKTTLIRTAHKGLATARNKGIAACQSKYVLPLDADDKIKETYLEKAVGIIDADERIGIVYCKAELFGTEFGPWEFNPTVSLSCCTATRSFAARCLEDQIGRRLADTTPIWYTAGKITISGCL